MPLAGSPARPAPNTAAPPKAPGSFAELVKLGSAKFEESMKIADESGNIEYDDGKYTQIWSAFQIKQADTANATWGVLFQFTFLEGDYASKIYFDWNSILHWEPAKAAEHIYNPFFIKRIEALTEAKFDELDLVQLESILEDALKKEQVWQVKLTTTTKDGVKYQNPRLIKPMPDYVLPGKKKTGLTKETVTNMAVTARRGSKATTAPVCPFQLADPVKWVEEVTTGSGRTAKTEQVEVFGIVAGINPAEETCSITIDGEDEPADLAWADLVYDEDANPAFAVDDEITWTEQVTETTGAGRNKKTTTTDVERQGFILSISEDGTTAEVEVETGEMETKTTGSGRSKKTEEVPVVEVLTVTLAEATLVGGNADDASDVPFQEGDPVKWSETETTGTGRAAKTETVEYFGTILSVNMETEMATVDTGETKDVVTGTGRNKKVTKSTPITVEIAFAELEIDTEEAAAASGDGAADAEPPFSEGDAVVWTTQETTGSGRSKKTEDVDHYGNVTAVYIDDEEGSDTKGEYLLDVDTGETETVTTGAGRNKKTVEEAVIVTILAADAELDIASFAEGDSVRFEAVGKEHLGTVVTVDNDNQILGVETAGPRGKKVQHDVPFASIITEAADDDPAGEPVAELAVNEMVEYVNKKGITTTGTVKSYDDHKKMAQVVTGGLTIPVEYDQITNVVRERSKA